MELSYWVYHFMPERYIPLMKRQKFNAVIKTAISADNAIHINGRGQKILWV